MSRGVSLFLALTVMSAVCLDTTYVYAQDSLFIRGGKYTLNRDLRKLSVRDLNNDGYLDVAVLEHTAPSVAILLNDGTGLLGTPNYFPCGVRPWGLDIGSLNADNTPDIAVANNPDANSTASVLFNNGQGVFGAPSSYTSGFRPVSVALTDIDGDNDMDMIVANHEGSLPVFENDGTGLFHERSRISLGDSPICVRSADFDADGDLDLVVLNRWSHDMAILLNNGTGDFQLSGRYPAGYQPEWASIADFDSDGDLDLVAVCLSDALVFFRNNGVAVFDNQVTTSGAGSSYQLAEADFDGDGDIDLAVPKINLSRVDIFLNDGTGSFSQDQSYPMGYQTYGIGSGDFNNDSLPDLVIANAGSQDIEILLNNSKPHMNTPPAAPVLSWPTMATTVTNAPTLSVENAFDAETDTLKYDFEIYYDSMLTNLAESTMNVPETYNPDTTYWTVSPPLLENKFYYWHARAFDGYEYSPWSGMRMFIANSFNEPPTAPVLLYPPDSSGLPLFNRKPQLTWTASTDPDPMDWTRYRFELATDPSFTFKWQSDSLWSNWAFPPDSLPYGSHYCWRVTALDRFGAAVPGNMVKDFWIWTLGDVDHSHNTDIADLTKLVDNLYINFTPITPLKVADLTGDCRVDISDLTRLVDYLYMTFTPLAVGCGP